MITLHRIGRNRLPLVLNCDLIATVEANPDTVITLVTGGLLVVSESPEQVVASVRAWRVEIGRQSLGVPGPAMTGADGLGSGASRPPAPTPNTEPPGGLRPL